MAKPPFPRAVTTGTFETSLLSYSTDLSNKTRKQLAADTKRQYPDAAIAEHNETKTQLKVR